MSAAALPTPHHRRPRDRRPASRRLTVVELRKMTDTRAGFWLLLAVGVLIIAAVVVIVVCRATRPTTRCATWSRSRSSRPRSCCRSSGSCSSARSGRSGRR